MGVVLIAFEREAEQVALEQLLSGRGHQVMKSSNGLAALDAARRAPPDLIVSDIVLPRMDGFALCRKWKQDERLQSIPFIFYTRRHDDPKYERFALELGAERFLARSVQPAALVGAVDELLAAAPVKSSPTMPRPTLDESAIRRAQVLEKAQQQQSQQQAQALERAQQTQSRLQAQLAELEATNQRLAAGEARFRRVFEANPLPMWIADHATGGFIAVNEAALALYGYSRAEFLSLKGAALSAPGALDSGDSIAAHLRKDGSTIHVALASRDIEFDGRSADLVSGYDLSERLATLRQLREQALAGRALLDSAADGCWVIDSGGRLLDVNAAYCRMSGYGRDALLAMRAGDLEVAEAGSGDTMQRPQPGRGGDRHETRHKRRDGTLMDVEVSVGMLPGDRGESIVLIRDISQRRREALAQRTRQRQVEFLADLTRQAESLDESAIVHRVIDQAAEAAGSPLAYLFFVDSAHRTMTLAAWRDGAQTQVTMGNAEARALPRGGVFTECVRGRHPTSSNDPSRKPQPDGLPDLQRYLAVPMIADEEMVGVLGVANRETAYGDDDQRALATLADGVSRVLQAKRAYARTLRSLQRTDVALQGMIDSFVRVTERHDPYTSGSARRLAALGIAIGREAGMDGEHQHALRIAALLHDIGNIAVPASILAKPAPLTETELALMRTHVEEGCQLLADIDFGAPIADIVYQHHERYDGSGYPRGLKGDEILLEARILAIADTVEAMCSPRPYRPAAGMEAAIEEVKRGAGKLYDPHLVAACTRLVRQHGFTLPE